jgi:hypothetical protein
LANARPDAAPDAEGKSIPEIASELWELAVAYAKQETIDPLRGLGRFLGFGIGGANLLGIGTSMLLLAGLRVLQTETSTTFTGSFSWAPYLIVLAVGIALSALALWRITSRKGPGL